MMRTQYQSGFSAVELLITLFIAAAFLIAGHQLYSAIIQDSGAARQKARASNVAYDYLRRAAATATKPCATSSSTTNITPAPEGLTDVTATTSYSCPQPGLSDLIKIEVKVSYGQNSPREEVVHAIYVAP